MSSRAASRSSRRAWSILVQYSAAICSTGEQKAVGTWAAVCLSTHVGMRTRRLSEADVTSTMERPAIQTRCMKSVPTADAAAVRCRSLRCTCQQLSQCSTSGLLPPWMDCHVEELGGVNDGTTAVNEGRKSKIRPRYALLRGPGNTP